MRKILKKSALFSFILAVPALVVALRKKLNVNQAKKNFPLLGKVYDVQGCSVHCLSEGKGIPIVLLHREKGDLYDFYLTPFWNKLKENYQLFAVDRPGYGYSSKANWKNYGFRNQGLIVHQVIKEAELAKPLLVACSEAAGVALSMLAENEEDYRGVFIIEDRLPEKIGFNDQIISTPFLGKIFLWTFGSLTEEMKIRKELKEKNVSGEIAQKCLAVDLQPQKILNRSENKKFLNIKELEKNISLGKVVNKPVVVIHGQNTNEYECLINKQNLNEIFKNLQIVKISEIHHFFDFLDSEAVLQELKKIMI